MNIIFTRKKLSERCAGIMMKYLHLAEKFANEESVRKMAMNRYIAIKELADSLGILDKTKEELEMLTFIIDSMKGEEQ